MSEEKPEPQETAAGTPAPAPVRARKPRTKQKIPTSVKTELLTLWRLGEATKPELSKKYGISEDRLTDLFDREGVKKGEAAAEIAAKRAAALEAALTLDPAVHARRVFDTKNETYRYIEMVRKLAAKAIVTCQQNGLPLGSIQNDMKALREAAQTFKVCREEAFVVLGIKEDDSGDDQLPDLVITGLDDEQIEELRNANGSDDGIADIPGIPDDESGGDVVIGGDDE